MNCFPEDKVPKEKKKKKISVIMSVYNEKERELKKTINCDRVCSKTILEMDVEGKSGYRAPLCLSDKPAAALYSSPRAQGEERV